MAATDDDRTVHPTDPTKVKAGQYMAFINWVKVKDAINPDHVVVTDVDGGGDIQIRGRSLVAGAFSADLFEETKKVTKTAAAEVLVSSFNRPLTVTFLKADGTERTMRCRLVKPEPLLGRSMVEDLEQADGNRVRLVDHRTIEWLIVDGVKYVVK